MPGCPSVTLLADLAVFSVPPDKGENGEPYQRRKGVGASLPDGPPAFPVARDGAPMAGSSSWRRIMLMILAITIHNIPGKSHSSVHPILTCGQPLPRCHPGKIRQGCRLLFLLLFLAVRRWYSPGGCLGAF